MKTALTYTVTLNASTVSVQFSRKPRLAARDLIKAAGLRWNPDSQTWTGSPADPDALRSGLVSIIGDPAPAPAPEYATPAERLLATRQTAMDGVKFVHIHGASTTYDLLPCRLLSLNCDELKTVDTVTNSIVDDEEAETVYAQLLALFRIAADDNPKKYAPRLRCIVKCCNDRLPA